MQVELREEAGRFSWRATLAGGRTPSATPFVPAWNVRSPRPRCSPGPGFIYLAVVLDAFSRGEGDAYDNAMAESFFASLECAPIDRKTVRER